MREDEAQLNKFWIEQPLLHVLDGFREHYDVMEHVVDQLAHDRDVFQAGREQGRAEAEQAARDRAEHMRCAEAVRGQQGGFSLLPEQLCYAGQAFEQLLSANQVEVAGGGIATASVRQLSSLKIALLQR